VSTVSLALTERSRKAHSLALQRLASVGQAEVARALDTSESTISRAVNGELERMCAILTAVGLKVVPAEMQCFPPRKVAILMELARDHLNQLETPEQLQWD
jgi:hypothetical protein